MKLNFSNVQTFGPMETDRVYGAEIESAVIGTSTGSGPGAKAGNPICTVRFKIVDTAGDDAAENRTMVDTLSLLDQGLFKMVGLLQAIGEVDPEEGLPDDYDFDPEVLKDRSVGLIMTNRVFEDEQRAQIRKYVNEEHIGKFTNEIYAS